MSAYDWQDMGSYGVRRLKVAIPFTQHGLAAETKEWGEHHRADFHDLTGDDEGYFKLISRLWSEGHEFYIVEQDVVPHAQQFTEMAACPHEWCAGVHALYDGAPEVWSLGCMKFGAPLLAQHLGADADDQSDDPDGAALLARFIGTDRHWYRVDLALYPVVRTAIGRLRGTDAPREPHLHGPAGRHLHHEMEARRRTVPV